MRGEKQRVELLRRDDSYPPSLLPEWISSRHRMLIDILQGTVGTALFIFLYYALLFFLYAFMACP
jgi:hypothetical protein